jgi:isopentenyldiphosphate isomerase
MPEQLDILDTRGTPTGRVETRARAHREGLWHRTVHVWVSNGRGEVLLQKRASDKETWPGRWDISAAGHIEAGGGSRAAAVREVAEELGIAIDAGELRHIATLRRQTRYETPPIRDNEVTDVYLVERDLPVESFRIQTEELSAVRWVSMDELARRVAEGDPSLVPHGEEYRRLFAFLRAGNPSAGVDKETRRCSPG